MGKMRTFKRFFLIFSCGILLSATGADLFIIQTIAWAKMTYAFSQRDSVKLAVQKTFDGKHPCRICKKVCELNSNSPRLKNLTFETKIEILQNFQIFAGSYGKKILVTFRRHNLKYVNSSYDSPPTPPPRLI